MGSFGEEPNVIDPTIGGLVWVCRNGSWWPGQIIGSDGVSEGCMPTSRARTPIKLLGRDDAIVEWLNLDKSKRVKAFRCGQFDYCIEKAKESSTTSHLIRKLIRYARREEAILEALKIESAHLALLDRPDFFVKRDEPSLKQENEDRDDGSEDDSESVHEISQTGVSINEQDLVDANRKESKRLINLNSSDDDGSEGVKRMRRIEDLGMGVASKTKGMGSLKVAKGHDFFKRKGRSRPLTKVLEVSRHVDCKVPFESHDSKKKNSVVINTSCSTTGVSCENAMSLAASMHGNPYGVTRLNLVGVFIDVPNGVAEKKNSEGSSKIVVAPSPASIHGYASLSGQSSHLETMYLESKEPNDSNSSSSSANIPTISHTLSKTTCNWRIKGKRNPRERKREIYDETETCVKKSRSVTEIHLAEITGWSMNAHRKELPPTKRLAGDLSQRLLPCRHSRFTVHPKYQSSDFPIRHHVNRPGLYDVNIEVKARRRPQGVPYISLMSKLYGQPVLGNPVELEVLEDGFCDSLLDIVQYDNISSEFDYCIDKVHRKRGTHRQSPGPLVTMRGTPRKHNYPRSRKSAKIRLLTNKANLALLATKRMRKMYSLSRLTANSEGEEEKKVLTKKVNPAIACVPLKLVLNRLNADLM